MAKRKFSLEDRLSVVEGWLRSDKPQKLHAAAHGISARTLRSWTLKHDRSSDGVRAVRHAVAALQSQLDELSKRLDALAVPAGDGEGSSSRSPASNAEGRKSAFIFDL